jgi:hypothetical protein
MKNKIRLSNKEKAYFMMMVSTYEHDGNTSLLSEDEFETLMDKLRGLI